jgi:hypothetical protein
MIKSSFGTTQKCGVVSFSSTQPIKIPVHVVLEMSVTHVSHRNVILHIQNLQLFLDNARVGETVYGLLYTVHKLTECHT